MSVVYDKCDNPNCKLILTKTSTHFLLMLCNFEIKYGEIIDVQIPSFLCSSKISASKNLNFIIQLEIQEGILFDKYPSCYILNLHIAFNQTITTHYMLCICNTFWELDKQNMNLFNLLLRNASALRLRVLENSASGRNITRR